VIRPAGDDTGGRSPLHPIIAQGHHDDQPATTLGSIGGSADFSQRRIASSVRDVLTNRAIEQKHILLDHA